MMTVSVGHHFSAGHRILGLTGPAAKCANLHGHTFTVCATFEQTSELAVEFTGVKRVLRQFIDNYLDHGYLVCLDDEVLLAFLRDNNLKHYVTASWPTTEVVAETIAAALQEFLPHTRLLSVEVGEGPHNKATWTNDHLDHVHVANREFAHDAAAADASS